MKKSTSKSYSPHLRIKTNTRGIWNQTKLDFQSVVKTELYHDTFAAILLDCFTKYSEQYQKEHLKDLKKIILEGQN